MFGQFTGYPQLSVVEPQRTPAHGSAAGVQHVPLMHSVPGAHIPQLYWPPQPSGTVPQAMPVHAVVIPVVWQHVLPTHSWPIAVLQLSVQETITPQLSNTFPQATPWQVLAPGVQHVLPVHSAGLTHVSPHITMFPQLSIAGPHAMSLQVVAIRFGVQQVFLMHFLPPPPHVPQLTWWPQASVTSSHVAPFAAQRPVSLRTGSHVPPTHASPAGQLPH